MPPTFPHKPPTPRVGRLGRLIRREAPRGRKSPTMPPNFPQKPLTYTRNLHLHSTTVWWPTLWSVGRPTQRWGGLVTYKEVEWYAERQRGSTKRTHFPLQATSIHLQLLRSTSCLQSKIRITPTTKRENNNNNINMQYHKPTTSCSESKSTSLLLTAP